MAQEMEIQALQQEWTENPRWAGIERPYQAEDVVRLRGSIRVQYTLAERGAERLWQMLQTEAGVATLGGHDREPGGADGQGWAAGDLHERLAGGGRC